MILLPVINTPISLIFERKLHEGKYFVIFISLSLAPRTGLLCSLELCFKWVYLSFLLYFWLFFSQLFVRSPQTAILLFAAKAGGTISHCRHCAHGCYYLLNETA